MSNWTLGFIGAGVMAETMISGVLDQGVCSADRVTASDPHASRREQLASAHGIAVTASNVEVATQADLLVLAVKPQSLAGVLRELSGTLREDTQVLSIVAGASLSAMRNGLNHARVARAMPNLPCRIHRGMTVWTGAEGTGAARIQKVLEGMGAQVQVEKESHVDRATAVNGTGPAIVAHFVKSFTEAAAFIGLPRDLAREAVLATLMGTAEMIRESEDHVAQLIDEVTSPGGTTSRAIQVLKQGRFAAVVTDSVDAAYQRTQELGDLLEEELKD
jgi:pyrroline-5-carboxylate reductase